jgi:hypothetical protein
MSHPFTWRFVQQHKLERQQRVPRTLLGRRHKQAFHSVGLAAKKGHTSLRVHGVQLVQTSAAQRTAPATSAVKTAAIAACTPSYIIFIVQQCHGACIMLGLTNKVTLTHNMLCRHAAIQLVPIAHTDIVSSWSA